MKKICIIIGLLVLAANTSFIFGQGYNISVHLNGLDSPEVLYLKSFQGYNDILIDSAKSQNNTFVFRNNKTLKPGIYFIQNPYGEIFEVLIDQNPSFSVEVQADNFGENLKFANSQANELYQSLVADLSPIVTELQREDSIFQSPASPEVLKEQSYARLLNLSDRITAVRAEFAKTHPEHIMSFVFKIQTDIPVPEPPSDLVTTEQGQLWQYQYYKDHFFDSVDFSDERLVRIPTIHHRIEFYLDNIIPQNADSVINILKHLIDKSSGNPEFYQYLLDYLTVKYEQSPFVNHDAVWVFLVENYYLNGKTPWVSSAALENYKTRLVRIKPLLIGHKPPEIWYPDSNNIKDFQHMTSLLSKASPFTVIIFFEPDCEHCQREMSKLKDLYKRKNELGFDVIAVSKDPSLEKMKTYQKKNALPFTTLYGGGGPGVKKREDIWVVDAIPTIFILDQDKRIISKKINVDRIESVIKNYKNK